MSTIKRSDIIDDDVFTKPKAEAEALLAVVKNLETSFKEILKETKKGIKVVDPKSADGYDKIKASAEKVKPVLDELNKLEAQRLKLEAEIKRLGSDEAYRKQVIELTRLKEQKKQYNQELRQEAISTDSTTGAYKKLSNELNVMRARYKDMAVQGKAQTQEATKLLQEITRVDSQLKAIDKSVGQNQREVGNYEDSIRRALSMFGPFGQQLSSALDSDIFKRASEGIRKIGFQFGATQQQATNLKSEVNNVQNQANRPVGFFKNIKNDSKQAKEEIKAVGKEVENVGRKTIGFKVNQQAVGQHRQRFGLPRVQEALPTNPVAGLNDTLGQTPTLLDNISSSAQGLGRSLFSFVATPIGAVITALGGLFALVVSNKETIIAFDNSMKDLEAITGATGDQLEFLKNQAIELGKATTGGAVAVVEAYKLIASAKPELLENADALNRVTQSAITLSEASGLDLQESATRLTQAMNQFGISADEADRAINVLAAGSKFGASEVPALTESLLKFGATAKGLKIPLEESVALVEAMAIAGLQGAEAGTAIRNVLLKISAPDLLPKEAQRRLNEYGVSFEKLKDTTIPFNEKLKELKPLLGDITTLGAVFGVENVNSAQSLIELSDTVKDLTKNVTGTTIAQEQASISNQKLSKRFEVLKQTFNSFILGIEDGNSVFSDFAKLGVDALVLVLKGFIKLGNGIKEMFKLFQDNKALFTSFIVGLGLMNVAFVNSTRALVMDTVARVRNIAVMVQQRIQSLLLTAQMSFQNIQTIATATGTNVLTVSMRALWLVMRANPLGVIATALTLVTGAMLIYISRTKELTVEQQALNDLKKEEAQIRTNEISQASYLVDIVNNQNLSYEQRNSALKELQKINPQYFKDLSLEAGAIDKNNELLKIYTKEIEKQSKLKALISLQDKTNAQIEEERAKTNEETLSTLQKTRINFSAGVISLFTKESYEQLRDIGVASDAELEKQTKIAELEKRKLAFTTEIQKLLEANPTLNPITGQPQDLDSRKEAQDKAKSEKQAQQQAKKDAEDREKELEDLRNKIREEQRRQQLEAIRSEREIILQNYKNEYDDLEKQYKAKGYLKEQYNQYLILIDAKYTKQLSLLAEKEAKEKEESDKKIIELETEYQKQLIEIQNKGLKEANDRQLQTIDEAIKKELELQERFIKAGVLDTDQLVKYYYERLKIQLDNLEIERRIEEANLREKYKNNKELLNLELDLLNKRFEANKLFLEKQTGQEAKQKSEDLTTKFKAKELEAQKDLYQNLNAIADAFYDREEQRIQRKIELIDKEIQASKDRQNQLTELAKQGIQDATNNLAFEQRKQAELEQKKIKEQQRAKIIELGLNALKTYTAKLENKDKNPLGSTIKDISFLTAFIRTLPAFYDGTENTGLGGTVDNKGGFLSILHPHERVVTAEQNKELKGISNKELVNIVSLWKSNLVQPKQNAPQLGFNSLNPLEIKQAIKEGFKSIDIPVRDVSFDKITGIVSEVVKGKTKTVVTSSKIRKKW